MLNCSFVNPVTFGHALVLPQSIGIWQLFVKLVIELPLPLNVVDLFGVPVPKLQFHKSGAVPGVELV